MLAKLEWANRSESERQLRDVAGIIAATTTLDRAYIETWAADLGVLELWSRAQALASG